MYLINTPTEISWVIEKTDKTVIQADLNFIITTPNKSVSYVPVGNLIPPSTTEEGLVTQSITPDSEGLWEVKLVKGAADTYTVLSFATLYVFEGKTTVYPLTYSGS